MKYDEAHQMEPLDSEEMAKPLFGEITFLWRMGGDRDDAKAALEAFSKEANLLIELIRLDVWRGDVFALRRHADSLHESASAISAARLGCLARKMAYAAERYDFDAARVTFPKLSAVLESLKAHLNADGWL